MLLSMFWKIFSTLLAENNSWRTTKLSSKAQDLRDESFNYNKSFMYLRKLAKPLIRSFREKIKNNIIVNRIKIQGF